MPLSGDTLLSIYSFLLFFYLLDKLQKLSLNYSGNYNHILELTKIKSNLYNYYKFEGLILILVEI